MNTILSGADCNALYSKVCAEILYHPDYEVAPRGKKIKELINATLILEQPRCRMITLVGRNMSRRYLAGELCFYFSGSDELSFISHYSKFWNNISDDGRTIHSNYGNYLFYFETENHISQFEYCLNCLKGDISSRKAVATIYDSAHHSVPSKDNPCTMNLQFFIRDTKLHMIVNMRSNDLWFGFTYDMPFFTIVQEMMYVCLKEVYPVLELGTYMHNVGSLHLYEKDWDKAETCTGTTVTTMQSMSLPEMRMESIRAIPELLEYEQRLRINCTGWLSVEPWTDWIRQNLQAELK